jgi:hypothetical protein
MTLGSSQSEREIITRSLPGGKGWPERKTDNLTASCEPISRKYGSLNISRLCGPARPVPGIALFFTFTCYMSRQIMCPYLMIIIIFFYKHTHDEFFGDTNCMIALIEGQV